LLLENHVALYPKNHSKTLSRALFKNPTAEYRAAPLWSWNNKLDIPQLLRQIDAFSEMGLGGAHIHPRTGLATEYLGDDFMKAVRACMEHAKKKGMLTWLYDEDRWPSGAAGGLATKEDWSRAKYLLVTPNPYGKGQMSFSRWAVSGIRNERGKLLWRWLVELNADGTLKKYRLLKPNENPKPARNAKIWYAYAETMDNRDFFNGQAYVDTLNPKAVGKFIEVTHERYRQVIGEEFGKSVPAIFTDEPQFIRKSPLEHAREERDLPWPFTDDLAETYFEAYGERLEETFPEVIWDLPNHAPSVARYRYHDHIAERFARGFADTIGAWCRKNGIALTGHMMGEETLDYQTVCLGEAMRSYRSFGIPGIDMLCDNREYTTAKQAQSAAHQFGEPGQGPVMSELYGLTGWHFDFPGHKRQGDWQAALGVAVRVPHLAWVSMSGESKRDFPASIGYQSPWYKRYKVVEDHFARVNAVLTRGRPLVRIGVLHSIESFWLDYGPTRENRIRREQAEAHFEEITQWLLFGTLDFDFIAESLLPQQNQKQRSKRFNVGEMAYDVVVAPGMRTIRGTTLERLEAFVKAGGDVLFVGEIPELVDAAPSTRAKKLAAKCRHVGFERVAILEALEHVRELRMLPGVGGILVDTTPASDPFLHQFRVDGERRYLFACNTDRERGRRDAHIQLRGSWKVELLDTHTGESRPLGATYENGWTDIAWDAPAHGSVLLELTEGQREKGKALTTGEWTEVERLQDALRITLAEPNALLLDLAEWRVFASGESGDKVQWEPLEDLLRIDNEARDRLGIPRRKGMMIQPWCETRPDDVKGTLELRFTVTSDVRVASPRLAVEDAQDIDILWDGKAIEKKIAGYFTDEAITTLEFPAIEPGEHTLLLRLPMKRTRNVEWCYILGDFGVKLAGHRARMIEPVEALAWGDWSTQGLPFYGGNVTYHCEFDSEALPEGPLELELRFTNPLVDVAVNGHEAQAVAFAPFRAKLGEARGKTTLDITAYGNRSNAFGCVHNSNPHLRLVGAPVSYRSTGEQWSAEYQLRPMGVLTAPLIKRELPRLKEGPAIPDPRSK
jgi:hypothetical protein